MNDNDGDNNDDDDKQYTSSPPSSALHAATGPLGRPRSTPVRERPGLSHPVTKRRSQVPHAHSWRARPICRAQLLKALVRTQDVENGSPAPAGNSREPYDEPGRLLPEPSNPFYDSEDPTTGGTGTQAKTRGRDPGLDLDPCRVLHENTLSPEVERRSSRQFSDRDFAVITVDSESVDDRTSQANSALSPGSSTSQDLPTSSPGITTAQELSSSSIAVFRRVR